MNDAYAPKVVLGTQKTVVNKEINNYFPHSLHSIKISKLSGLFNDDKELWGGNKAEKMR